MNQESGRIARAAGVMMLTIFLSRVLGQVRDLLIAYWFGQTLDTAVYLAAFSIPDLLFFLLAGGALSSAFIPVFTEYLTSDREEEAWKVFSIIATFLAIAIGCLVLLGEVFARPLMGLLVPGFSPEAMDRAAGLSRIVMPAQICFFLGGLMMGALNVRGYFLIPALGPVIYNAGIILGGWLLGRVFGMGVAGLSWGAMAGAFAGNFLLPLLCMRRAGLRFRPSLHLSHPGVLKAGKLALPVLVGLSMPQVYVLVNKYFGSMLEENIIPVLDNANKIMHAPLGMVGQAISVAIFPALAALVSRGDREGFHRTFFQGIRALWFLTLPISVLMILLSRDIVSILLQYGKFTPEDTVITSQALVIYCLGLFAFSCQAMLNRAFYAVQDTITPVVIGTLMAGVFVVLNVVLIGPLGFRGLALAGSLAAVLHVLVMLGALRWRTGIPVSGLFLPFVKMLAASAACGALGWVVLQGWLAYVRPLGLYDKVDSLIVIVLVSTVGAGAFYEMAWLLRCEEIDTVGGIVMRRLKRGRR